MHIQVHIHIHKHMHIHIHIHIDVHAHVCKYLLAITVIPPSAAACAQPFPDHGKNGETLGPGD